MAVRGAFAPAAATALRRLQVAQQLKHLAPRDKRRVLLVVEESALRRRSLDALRWRCELRRVVASRKVLLGKDFFSRREGQKVSKKGTQRYRVWKALSAVMLVCVRTLCECVRVRERRPQSRLACLAESRTRTQNGNAQRQRAQRPHQQHRKGAQRRPPPTHSQTVNIREHVTRKWLAHSRANFLHLLGFLWRWMHWKERSLPPIVSHLGSPPDSQQITGSSPPKSAPVG